jgi:4a-hydroxytetrahydrobiopterin dehydratase
MDSAESNCMLHTKHCRPCESGTPPLDKVKISALLQRLDGWQQTESRILKTYQFKNFHQTMAFVNAVAWIAHREGHHPDLHVGFNRCEVSYTTHAIAGLSENDFICAAKIDALLTSQEV